MRVTAGILTFAMLSFCTSCKYASAGTEFHQECARYGQLATAIAMDRDRGMPLKSELAGFRARGASPTMMKELAGLADFIYNNPLGRMQAPESVGKSMAVECSVRIDQNQKNSQDK